MARAPARTMTHGLRPTAHGHFGVRSGAFPPGRVRSIDHLVGIITGSHYAAPMSMLTPPGMGGKYRITGDKYPRMRRPRVAAD